MDSETQKQRQLRLHFEKQKQSLSIMEQEMAQLEQKKSEFYEGLGGISSEQVVRFISDKRNFTPQVWESLEAHKKRLEEEYERDKLHTGTDSISPMQLFSGQI